MLGGTAKTSLFQPMKAQEQRGTEPCDAGLDGEIPTPEMRQRQGGRGGEAESHIFK